MGRTLAVLLLMVSPVVAFAAYVVLVLPLSRYRVVWVRLDLYRNALTRWGARRTVPMLVPWAGFRHPDG